MIDDTSDNRRQEKGVAFSCLCTGRWGAGTGTGNKVSSIEVCVYWYFEMGEDHWQRDTEKRAWVRQSWRRWQIEKKINGTSGSEIRQGPGAWQGE